MTIPTGKSVCVCAVGYKGLKFLELARQRINISQVISYEVSGKEGQCHKELLNLCKAQGWLYTDDRHPDVEKIESELIYFVGWQFLLSKTDRRCIVFHDSLLPRYRGFAPTVSALINGDEKLGVTALLPGLKADEGPIVSQAEISVRHPVRIKDVFDELAHCYLTLGLEIASGPVPPPATAQSTKGASFSLWRDESDYFIEWSQSSDLIQRQIFACSWPYDGARTRYEKSTIIIDDAEALADELPIEQRDRMCGKFIAVHDGEPLVVCGEGLLKIKAALDLEGARIRFRDSIRQRLD